MMNERQTRLELATLSLGSFFLNLQLFSNIYIYIDLLLFTSLTVLNLIVICTYIGIFIYICFPYVFPILEYNCMMVWHILTIIRNQLQYFRIKTGILE